METQIVIFLLLVAFTSTAASCGLDEYQCTQSGKCINREMQCDGHDDCGDGTDEVGCDEAIIESCSVKELSCTSTADDKPVRKCYNTREDICKPGGFNALCDGHEDVKHCRCDPNEGTDAPMRCPTTGDCVPAKTLDQFCEKCPTSDTCKAKTDADIIKKCEFEMADYFRCKPLDTFSTETYVCLPEAAKCDSFIQCSGSTDNPMRCAEAQIKLETSKTPTNVYIGDEVVLKYTLIGTPIPAFEFFHYSKKIPFDDNMKYSYGGTDISVKATQTNTDKMEYTVTMTNITEYFYGGFDAIAWNVINDTYDLGGGNRGSYHRRVDAEQVNIKFEGTPTAVMHGPDGAALSDDVDHIWETTANLSLKCVATGKPEPTILFKKDGGGLYIDNVTVALDYEAEEEYDAKTMTKSETLILIENTGNTKETPGKYSCSAESILGEVDSKGGVKIDLVIPPHVTTFTGMSDGFYFYKAGETVSVKCVSKGYPNIWNYLYVDGDKMDQEDVIVTVDVATDTATLMYNYTSDADGSLKCEAKTDKQDESSTVAFYPVVEPVIKLEAESFTVKYGDSFETEIEFNFTESLTNDPDRMVTEVLDEDGNQVAAPWNLTKKNSTAENGHITVYVLSDTEIGIPNDGTIKVVAKDGFYTVEKTIVITVLADMKFTEEIGENKTLNKGFTLELDVSVLAKPVPEKISWTLNDVALVKSETISIEESFDEATYITTYTLKIEDIQLEDEGEIKVEITRGENEALTASMNLHVIDHPCYLNPHPCQNGAPCHKLNETDYSCNCTEDFYTGKNCSVSIICENGTNPCQNNATCMEAPYNAPDPEERHYICKCPFEYDDRNCSTEVDFCEMTKMLDDDVEVGGGTVKCHVDSGSGMCHETKLEPEGFDCYCKHSVGGKYCNMEQLCTPNPCVNGDCVVSGHGDNRAHQCNCLDGWKGATCEEKVPGHCYKADCNGKGYCEERGENEVCLCDYPFYGDHCEEQIADDVVNMNVPQRAYLLAKTKPTIPEERLQKYILPIEIKTLPSASCRIARISVEKDGSGGHLDFGISVTTSNDSDPVVEFEVSGQIGENATSATNEMTDLVSITLMVVGDSYAIVSVEQADGGIFVHKIAADIPEMPYLKLGDFKEKVGCEMALIGEVVAGSYVLEAHVGYSEGRSVVPLGACYHNPCENGGKCVDKDGPACNCTGTGFMGDHCEKPIDDSCEKGCLNGGSCHGGYCVCALSYHGVLCEASHPVTGSMRLSGDVSEITFSHSDITSVSILATGLESVVFDSDVYLLTLGQPENSIKILASEGGMLYMLVTRGRESGAYDVKQKVADYLKDSTFNMTIAVVANEDIHITGPAPAEGENHPVTFTADELPCPDGLGSIEGLAIHGIADVTYAVTVGVNGETVMATGGKGVVSSDVAVSMCVEDETCGTDGTCTQDGNQIKCSDCPAGHNPVTCSDEVCDPDVCKGECTDIGECVCKLGYGGDDCTTEIEYGTLSLPVTTSSHYSYAQYGTELMQGDAVQISFSVKLEGTEQSGLLACAGDDRQYVAVKLDKDIVKVDAHCSELISAETSLSGVSYGEWQEIGVMWYNNFLTLTIGMDKSSQVEVGTCIFTLGTTLYLGGMPDGSMPSVKATFAPVSYILPPTSKLAGGQSLGVAATHICDTEFHPCSRLGPDTKCKKDEEMKGGFKCVCDAGFKGTLCDTPKTPCDNTVCQKNEVCIEDDGSCLCDFPYTRASDVCETVLGDSTGFVMEGDYSYAVISTDMADVINNFEVAFRFYLSDVESYKVNKTYDIASLTYGQDAFVGLDLIVDTVTITEDDKNVTKVVTIVSLPALRWNHTVEGKGWHVVRVQTSGAGTVLEVDGVSYSSELGVPLVTAVRLGVDPGQGSLKDPSHAFMDCIGNIMINGELVTKLDNGVGIKSCSHKIPNEYENLIGVEILAKLGLL